MAELTPEPRLLPDWADRVRRLYLRGESSLFLLHHNVFDRVPHEAKLVELTEFLKAALLENSKHTILVYDPSSRVRVVKRAPDAAAIESVANKRSPGEVLPALEELLFTTTSTAIIIKYLDVIAPAGEMQFMAEQDRVNVVTLHRWSLDPRLSERDNVVFVLAEQLSSVHPMLLANPRVAPVELPMPGLVQRTLVCKLADPSLGEREAHELGKHTAGLKAVQIHDLLTPDEPVTLSDAERHQFILTLLGTSADAELRAKKLSALTRSMNEAEIRHLIKPGAEPEAPARADPLSEVLSLVRARKREIIEKECLGLIEFMEPKHGFSAVGGMDEIKLELAKIADAIRLGERARVPMGILFVGPMGTGKTFVASALAKESGILAIKLKNFRSKWVGATEANLEKVLTIVRALGPIFLVIDEGERSFGDAGDSDGGTSSRVIARMKEFMSDPENRGQVVFLLMTNRPDKLDLDIKRAGRLDRKIPFFYAGTAGEVESILLALFQRHGVHVDIDWAAHRSITSQKLIDYSNADLEGIALLAFDLAHDQGERVTAEILERAISDYLPARDAAMLRYMELLAVFEASNRRMLPLKYREMSNDELERALREARLAVASGHAGKPP
jgi:SpoVK/Ycf46/Vps4 family AAA+-type ATPase